MRLIDADLLKENISKWLKPSKPDETEMIDVADAIVSTMMEIDEQPTAYDTDKVVEQLQEMKEEDACKNISCVLCKYTAECMAGEMGEKVAIDRAIEIVEGGGAKDEIQKEADNC